MRPFVTLLFVTLAVLFYEKNQVVSSNLEMALPLMRSMEKVGKMDRAHKENSVINNKGSLTNLANKAVQTSTAALDFMSQSEVSTRILSTEKLPKTLADEKSKNEPQKLENMNISSTKKRRGILCNEESNSNLAPTFNATAEIFYQGRLRRSLSDGCAWLAKCKFISTIPEHRLYCHCDDACFSFNDCCPEKRLNITTGIEPDNRFQCLKHGVSNVYGMMVATHCLSSNDLEMEMQCLHGAVETSGPWVIDEEGLVYKNKYCAICNNVTSFQLFKVILFNVNSEILNRTTTEKLRIHNVSAQFVPPANKIPRSCLLFTDPANPSDMCLNYGTNPVQTYSGVYRNVFCIPDEGDWMKCAFGIDDMKTSILDSFLYPLTVLFTFSESSAVDEKGVADSHIEERYVNYHVGVSFGATVEGTLQQNTMMAAVFIFFWSLVVDNFSAVKSILSHYIMVENQTELFIEGQMVLTKPLLWSDAKHYENIIQEVRRKIVITNHQNDSILIDFKNTIDLYVPQNTLFETNITDPNEFEYHLNNIVSKNRPSISTLCSGMLFHVDSPVNDSNYLITMYDCNLTDYSVLNKSTGLLYLVKAFTTYIGFVLSIISLLCLIVLNRRYDQNQNIGGANCENIYISQLMSICLFVFGVGLKDNYVVCKTLAVLLHFSWVTMFSYKTIAVICIFTKIRKLENIRPSYNGERTRSIVYLRLLGLALPLVVVVPMVVLDQLSILNYMNERNLSICFPTAFPANLFFMTGPIMVSLFINITCLFCTIIHIRKTKSVSKLPASSISRKSYNEALIYLRFSLISGLPWVLGIISAVVESDVLDFIFIVTCSLQGVFFLVSNLTMQSFRQKIGLVSKDTTKQSRVFTTKLSEDTF